MKHRISICLSDLGDLARANHPSVVKSDNGKTYIYADLWLNDTPDKRGNDIAIKVYDKNTKESKYIGNGKQNKPGAPTPAQQENANKPESDSLPF